MPAHFNKLFFLFLIILMVASPMIVPCSAGSVTFNDLSNQMGLDIVVYTHDGTLIGIYNASSTIPDLFQENESYIFQLIPSKTDYYARNSTALFGLINVSLPIGFNVILVGGMAIGILFIVISGLVLWVKG